MKKKLPLLQAIATLVGTIIGAGILGLPYVFSKSGFWVGAIVLAVITFAMISIKLMFGEMTLRTYGKHQTAGYVEKYLGTFWKKVVSAILVLTISGSVLAYFIGIGQVLADVFGGTQLYWSLGFYVIGSIFLFRGINIIKKAELFLTTFIIFFVAIIIALAIPFGDIRNLTTGLNLSNMLLPYGVILFALSGIVAVPEVRQILHRRENLFKKAILIGSLTPAVIYFFFTAAIVAVTGLDTTEVATIGLGHVIGEHMVIIGNLFAFFAMSTSFLTLGLALKEVYHYDFKIKHIVSWLITIVTPLLIYFLGFHDFIQLLALAGALGYGVNGVIYIFAYWSSRRSGKRKPEYRLSASFAAPASLLLVVIFVVGLIYTLI